MKHRIISVLLAVLVLFGCMSAAFAQEAESVHPAQAEIDRVLALGLLSVNEDGDFQPDAPMTRAMFVTALGSLAQIDPADWQTDYLAYIFTDVSNDAYYAPYLAWALHNGILSGLGGSSFCPNEPIHREQAAQAVAAFLAATGRELASKQTSLSAEPEEPAQIAATLPTEPLADAPTLSVITPEDRQQAASEPADESPEEPAEAPTEAETEEAQPRSGLAMQHRDVELSSISRRMLRDSTPTLETEALLMAYYTDADEISEWARNGVCLLQSNGLISGRENPDGGLVFAPKDGMTRAECAVLLCGLADQMQPAQTEQQQPRSIILNTGYLEMDAEQTGNLVATVFPMNGANQTVVWYSDHPDVVSVDLQGNLTALSGGEATVYAISSNRMEQCCVIEVTGAAASEPESEPEPEPEPEPETEPATEPAPEPVEQPTAADEPQDTYTEDAPSVSIEAPTTPGLGSITMSDYEKDLLIFGQEVADPRLYYATDADALAMQTVIVVKTWDLASDGTKYTRTWNLQIHKNIAATAQAIFDEIYALPEMPVIHSLGGWRANAGKSEHKPGLAIDINWLENYYCDPNGKAITGYYFKPDEDPYSIPIGGSIDQIFNKYGFIRGIYWRTGYRDYMHYSFYGT